MNQQERERLKKMLLKLIRAQDAVTYANENAQPTTALIVHRDGIRMRIIAFVEQLTEQVK